MHGRHAPPGCSCEPGRISRFCRACRWGRIHLARSIQTTPKPAAVRPKARCWLIVQLQSRRVCSDGRGPASTPLAETSSGSLPIPLPSPSTFYSAHDRMRNVQPGKIVLIALPCSRRCRDPSGSSTLKWSKPNYACFKAAQDRFRSTRRTALLQVCFKPIDGNTPAGLRSCSELASQNMAECRLSSQALRRADALGK